MAEYAAFAADFYINLRLNLKMDLSMRRDTVLSLFDRIRREQPHMDRFKRYTDELALESRSSEGRSAATMAATAQQWIAVRKTSVRSGCVNPGSLEQGYGLHKLVLESAPYYLDIPPLDIDHIEVLYGFDVPASGNHDQIVFQAMYGNSPMGDVVAALNKSERQKPAVVECQPLVAVALTSDCTMQAHFEIKTRTSTRQVRAGEYRDEPISVYLIVRRYGPVADVKQLEHMFTEITAKGEELLDTVVVPKLLKPVNDAIMGF